MVHFPTIPFNHSVKGAISEFATIKGVGGNSRLHKPVTDWLETLPHQARSQPSLRGGGGSAEGV